MKTGFASTDKEESERTLTKGASVSVSGKWCRNSVDPAEYLDGPPQKQEKRYRADALRLACDAEEEGVKGHAQWRRPELESRADAAHPSLAERADAVYQARKRSRRRTGTKNCLLTFCAGCQG